MFILPRATRPGPSAKEHLCRLGAGKVVFGTEVDVGVMGVAVAALALLAKFASLGATSTAACAYRGVSRPPPPADPGLDQGSYPGPMGVLGEGLWGSGES